jgi:hypothetical protein
MVDVDHPWLHLGRRRGAGQGARTLPASASPDGKTVAAANTDGNTYLWQIG